MRFWHDFLDSLDSDGGHVLVLLILIAGGMLGELFAVPKSEDLFLGAFGALFLILKDSGSNKTRRDRLAPVAFENIQTTQTQMTEAPEAK